MIQFPIRNNFGKQQFTLIDDTDVALIGDRKWAVNHYGYVINRRGGKNTRLHREILGAKEGDIVDHINRDKLDNRRENLRFVSWTESAENRGFNNAKKKYKDLPMHITYEASRQKYVAGKRRHRKRFDTLEEAVAYIKYEETIAKYEERVNQNGGI